MFPRHHFYPHNACGDYCTNTKEGISEIVVFSMATKDLKFVRDERDFKNKVPVRELEIIIAVCT